MTDLNTALLQQFLDVSATEGKTVVEPNGVLDDGHLENGGGTVSGQSWTVSLPRPS